jgi:hypothetical protein
MRICSPRRFAAFLLAASLVADTVSAQCTPPSWTQFAGGTDGYVSAMIRRANGDLVLGGTFTHAGGVAANSIAIWNGTTWSPLGAGLAGAISRVYGLLELPNGDLLAGGTFTSAGGIAVNMLARWDGTNWSSVGFPSTPGVEIKALALRPNGDVLVAQNAIAGSFAGFIGRIWSWDGNTWTLVGTANGVGSPPVARIECFLVEPNGDVIAAGQFETIDSTSVQNLARWNGSSWSFVAPGTDARILALALLSNGDLAAGGYFSSAGAIPAAFVARWDGSTWSSFGSGVIGLVTCLLPMPNGELIAAGNIGSLPGPSFVERWDGLDWLTPTGPLSSGLVSGLTMAINGSLLVSGAFPGFVLERVPTCPPTGSVFAVGCPGSGGSNSLTVTHDPVLGGTFRVDAAGLPSRCVVASVFGLTSSTPGTALDSLFAEALPGCSLRVSTDILQTLQTTTGAVESSLALPAAPGMLGVAFYHQMVPFEVDLLGGIVSIRATDALALTIGAL